MYYATMIKGVWPDTKTLLKKNYKYHNSSMLVLYIKTLHIKQ